MDKQELMKLTDDELRVKKRELKRSKIEHAIYIGFLAGILLFGFTSWILSSEKRVGFLIPMFIPIIFIYNLLKNSKKNKALEEVLKDRNLD